MRVTAALAGMLACAEPPRALSLRWAGWRPRRAAIPGLAPPCGVPKLDRAVVADVFGALSSQGRWLCRRWEVLGVGVVLVRDVRVGDGARVLLATAFRVI